MLYQAFRLEILADALNRKLSGKRLDQIFSTSLSDLWLEFEHVTLHLVFYRGQMYWLNVSEERVPTSNRMPQSKTLHGKVLLKCLPLRYDRCYTFEFEDQKALHFLHYGSNSRVLATSGTEVTGAFPPTESSVPQTFIPQKIQIGEDLLSTLSPESSAASLRFLDANQLERLRNDNFYEAPDKWRVWEEFVRSELALRPLYDRETRLLNWVKPEVDPDVLAELDLYARDFLRIERFTRLQEELSRRFQKEISNALSKLESIRKSLKKREAALSYRQLADILMANLHLPVLSEEMEFYDFYHDRPVRIKLKTGLSLQENAARLYRKAKQEHLEVDELTRRCTKLESDIQDYQSRLTRLEQAVHYKDLTEIAKKQSAEKGGTSGSAPFKSIDYQGFAIRIGGNSKQNELIFREARKDDLWLHARDYSGSHVVIRIVKEQKVPEHVLEFAASLAAWHSKARNESIAAVIYTPRKFVRKFKGALAGQVKVDRESTLLIEPGFWKSCPF